MHVADTQQPRGNLVPFIPRTRENQVLISPRYLFLQLIILKIITQSLELA